MTISGTRRTQSLLSAQQPLFYAVLAFGVGILLADQLWLRAAWWIAAVIVFLLCTVLFSARRTIAFACGLLALNALGALNFQLRQRPAVSSAAIAELSDGSEVIVTGHVIRDGIFRAATPQRQTVDLETQTIERNGSTTTVRVGLRLTIYQRPSQAEDDLDEQQAKPAVVSPWQFVYGAAEDQDQAAPAAQLRKSRRI